MVAAFWLALGSALVRKAWATGGDALDPTSFGSHRASDGTEVVYSSDLRLATESRADGDPAPQPLAGVFLLFHGCTHQAVHWTYLPEEVRFLQALKRKNVGWIAFTSPSGAERNWCWPSDPAGIQNVLEVVEEELAKFSSLVSPKVDTDSEEGAGGVPRVCVGGSSGGNLVGSLAQLRPNLCAGGLAVYVSPTELTAPVVAGNEALRRIPAVFVYMPRDTSWATRDNVEAVARSFERSKTFAIEPRALTDNEVTPFQRKWLVDLGILDGRTGMVAAQDPRTTPHWRQAIFGSLKRHPPAERKRIEREMQQLEELLNRAWAQHEFAADHAAEVVDFILGSAEAPGAAPEGADESARKKKRNETDL